EFIQAINNAISLINSKLNDREQQSFFLDSYKKETQTKKLVLRTLDYMDIVEVADIVWCKSDNSYTTFYFSEDKPITVSKGIHEYEDLLKDFGFFRPHRSYLVNLNHVKKVDKNDGGFIIMKNQKEIPISVRLKKSMIRLLQEL
ncbi:MAG: LytTR family transcriptional regulator, partial [Bacteroidales bacterium]|nr:LytTR family transcriptional regulator [Bacteroidales bacterium]